MRVARLLFGLAALATVLACGGGGVNVDGSATEAGITQNFPGTDTSAAPGGSLDVPVLVRLVSGETVGAASVVSAASVGGGQVGGDVTVNLPASGATVPATIPYRFNATVPVGVAQTITVRRTTSLPAGVLDARFFDSAPVRIAPADFRVSEPDAVTDVPRGGSATVTVTVTPNGGSGGAIPLSANSRDVTLSPGTLTFASGSAAAQTTAVTYAAPATTPVGTVVPIEVGWARDGFSRIAVARFRVTAAQQTPSFDVSAAPGTAFVQNAIFTGYQTLTITPRDGFSSDVSVQAAFPPGVSYYPQDPGATNPFTLPANGSRQIRFYRSQGQWDLGSSVTLTITGGGVSRTLAIPIRTNNN